MAGEKTEKATPKRQAEARKKGQHPKSMDLNSAVVLMAALLTLGSFGPKLFARMEDATVTLISMTTNPSVVDRKGIGAVVTYAFEQAGLAAAPILLVCAGAAVVANLAQVGLRPSPAVLKPNFGKLNPIKGFKQTFFTTNSLVELGKNLIKVGLVGGMVAFALLPKMTELAALVGTPGPDLLPMLAHEIFDIAKRAAGLYLAIALADVLWQRYRFAKNQRMDKQEVKDEAKQTELPSEVRGAMRRKAFQLASQRMMDAVPTADVVVVNPTHYAVALKYSSEAPAPVVVAKGVDNLAARIREAAKAADVAIVPDPPLARTLYGTVDVGKMIPEDLFHAVAQLLAYVYRVAGARKAVAA
jgi:flagellar biosynthetic protein FlhB